MKLIETKNLCRTFRNHRRDESRAVDDLSLTIEAGTLTVFTGPSGSGKTTLLSLLGALDRPSSGQVLFESRDFGACSDTELARLRRRMGFVFQDFALVRGLSTLDNITYPLIPRGIRRRDREQIASELLDRLEIPHCRTKHPEQLSGGEKQRVAVARALAGKPEVLLVDEPTSNLDHQTGQRFIALLRDLMADETTIVVATHDPRLVEMTDSVYQLDQGRLVDEN